MLDGFQGFPEFLFKLYLLLHALTVLGGIGMAGYALHQFRNAKSLLDFQQSIALIGMGGIMFFGPVGMLTVVSFFVVRERIWDVKDEFSLLKNQMQLFQQLRNSSKS